MHILEIPSFFPPHGGLFCLEQAKALRDIGHEVRILACTNLGLSVDKTYYITAPWGSRKTEMEGIEVYARFQRDLPKMVFLNTAHWLNTVYNMYREYERLNGKPDIIHAHCCKLAGIAAMKISETTGIPYYITEHLPSELYVKDFGEGWTRHQWLRELMKRAYEGARSVIPVAEELVDDIAPFFGKSYRYHEISNIIDTDFYAFRQRKPQAGRPFRYCCLAIADIHRKGYDVLAEAWRGITDAELHIAGSGTDGEQLRQLFEGCANMHFHGHLDKHQVRELLYQSDALVLPSRSEAQPLVLLEAMSTGIPVVATECTPRSERIPHACLISKTADAHDLRQKMMDARHIAPSEAITQAVQQLCSPRVVAQQIEELVINTKNMP